MIVVGVGTLSRVTPSDACNLASKDGTEFLGRSATLATPFGDAVMARQSKLPKALPAHECRSGVAPSLVRSPDIHGCYDKGRSTLVAHCCQRTALRDTALALGAPDLVAGQGYEILPAAWRDAIGPCLHEWSVVQTSPSRIDGVPIDQRHGAQRCWD